ALTGMQRLADTLHPHGVPITWMVSPDSARVAAKELSQWHDQYGDDVAIAPPELSITTVDESPSYEKKLERLAGYRTAIQQALPWAECTVASGHTDPDIVRICNELGIEGLWGFCVEQIAVDDITDRGCPWGAYYMHSEDRLRPAKKQSAVAFEWTARDLLKSFHSGNPCLYSTDPNDVARGSICSWENIDYWKAMADTYIRNTRYNQHVFLTQQQEAHEMEIADGWRCYTDEDIQESIIMLEEFVKHIKPYATMMTLGEAAKLYRDTYTHTPSSYMLWEDIPTERPNPDFIWNTCPGPWPKTFLYYDRDVQMAFIDGQVQPMVLRNYNRSWKSGEYYAEPIIPRPKLIRDTRFTWNREIEISVFSDSDTPYGMVLWGDYSLYQLGDAPGLIEGKVLPHELLFLRYNLKKGENRFVVKLTGK
ncbi:MAG: hypothetical protein KAH38_08515, partial [Candidatus Hydrogenedentes bacterium]|nr:hypothetical protein [Candidatus Hydrogenedentota bacterium]